jgi:hypothetical protein
MNPKPDYISYLQRNGASHERVFTYRVILCLDQKRHSPAKYGGCYALKSMKTEDLDCVAGEQAVRTLSRCFQHASTLLVQTSLRILRPVPVSKADYISHRQRDEIPHERVFTSHAILCLDEKPHFLPTCGDCCALKLLNIEALDCVAGEQAVRTLSRSF